MPKKPDNPDWAEAVRDVTPLGGKRPPTPAMPPMPKPTGTPPKIIPPEGQNLSLSGWYDTPPFPLLSNIASCIAGVSPDMDKPLFKKLSTGQLRPTAVMDLHGLGEDDAWLEMVGFLHEAVTRDHRCILLIHGKGTGYGPHRDMGVIKFQIGGWLAAHPKVLGFHTALPQDGGSGALYVYLRRFGHTAASL